MFKADDYRLRLKSLADTLAEAKYALDIDNLGGRLEELKAEQEKPEVWGDLEKSKKIGRDISSIEGKMNAYNKGENAIEEAKAFIDLIEEADDESLIPELEEMIKTAEDDIENMRIRALLKGKYDSRAAPKPATGRRCSTACTAATASSRASKSPNSISKTATKPA